MLKKRKSYPLNSWESMILERSMNLDTLYKNLGLYPKDMGVWSAKHTERLDISNFRSDNVYVWQSRNSQENQYLISFLLAKLQDHGKLLEAVSENGTFGVEAFEFFGEKVSRDRIDSSLEINFLTECVSLEKIRNFRILDIGAGYGRLAKNLCSVFPEVKVNCVDSVPISTAISEYYLKAQIDCGQVKIYDLAGLREISVNSIDLATNIHSFSEMSLESVRNWVKFLREKNVPRLFVVPNPSELRLNSGEDFQHIFEEYGYAIKFKRPKFPLGINPSLLLYPSNYYYLEME